MARRFPERCDGVALGLMLLAWGTVLVWRVSGPLVLPDELVGIGLARYLFGHGRLPELGIPAMPGTAVLLAPFAAFAPWFDDPARLLPVARALDVVCFASLGPMALAVMRVLAPGATRGSRFLAASAAALYPPLVLSAHVAMTEAPMAVAVTATAWLLARSGTDASSRSGLALGGVIGLMPLIHLRGLVPAAVGAAVLVASLVRVRAQRRTLALGLAAALVTLALGFALDRHVVAARPESWTGTSTPHALPTALPTAMATALARSIGVLPAARLLGAFCAQVLYVLAATLGIAGLGIVAAAPAIAKALRNEALDGGDRVRAFAGLTQLGTLAMAALFLNGFDRAGASRAEGLLLGRAHDAVILPTLLVGLATLLAPRRRPLWASVAGLSTAAIACGALFAWRTTSEVSAHGINWINLLGVHAACAWLGRASPWILVALAIGGGALLQALHAWRPRLALVSVALAFGLAASVTSERYFVDGSRFHQAHRALVHAAHLARQANPDREPLCIAVERAPRLDFIRFDLAFQEPDVTLRRFDPARDAVPCDDASLLREPPAVPPPAGARRIAVENDGGAALWALPGPLLEALAARGAVLAEPPDAPLARSAMQSRIELIGTIAAPLVVRHGEAPVRLLARIENGSRDAPWPNGPSLRGSGRPVRLGSRWVRADGRVAIEGRSELPNTLFPGESTEVEVTWPPPLTGPTSLPPGPYRVQLGLLQEGVRWFADAGDRRLELDVAVE